MMRLLHLLLGWIAWRLLLLLLLLWQLMWLLTQPSKQACKIRAQTGHWGTWLLLRLLLLLLLLQARNKALQLRARAEADKKVG
jgi:hypothetical protein